MTTKTKTIHHITLQSGLIFTSKRDFSGFPAIPEKQAVEKMRAMIQKSKAERGNA